MEMFPQAPDLKTLVYCGIHRDLSGGDKFDQHCANSFGKDLNVTDGGLSQIS